MRPHFLRKFEDKRSKTILKVSIKYFVNDVICERRQLLRLRQRYLRYLHDKKL